MARTPRLFVSMSLAATAMGLGACANAPDPVEPIRPWSCSPRLHLSSVWQFLADKYDHNGDGRVTRGEYARSERKFDNFDRDGDGELSAADFPDDTFFNGFNHMIVLRADDDEDQRVTRAEWEAFGARFDADRDGVVRPAEAAAVLGALASDWRLFLLAFDQNGDGRFTGVDLDLTFRDQDFDGDGSLAGRELESWRPANDERPEAPAPGDVAPDFTLTFAADPSRTFHLAEAVRERPVALVFGSYT